MALRTKSARRMTDRVEDMAAWVLMAAGLLVVLFSYGVGAQSYNQGLEQVQMQSAERAPAEATLLSDAQLNSSVSSRSSMVMAPATWQDRVGAAHDGFVMVPRGLRAGGKVPIWTDVSGANVPAPMTNCEANTSVSRLQLVIPNGVRFSGRGNGGCVASEKPINKKAAPSGRLVRSTVKVLPSIGRLPVAAASVGTPAEPAQPAP